jgi:enamine deaminase RidA (YjgF/YER057c/UK114 family)
VVTGCKTELKMIEIDSIYKTRQFGFSQTIEANGFLFASGQVGWGKTYKLTGQMLFENQVKQSFINVKQVVEVGNSSLNKVVHIRFL